MATQLIAKVSTDITPEETFTAPSLTDASRGIAALLLSAMATQGQEEVPHPKRVRVRLYKGQFEADKILEHTVIKLADIEAEFEVEERFKGVPQHSEEGLIETPSGPLVTLT